MLPPLRCLLLLLSSIIATDGVVVPVIRNPTGKFRQDEDEWSVAAT